MTVQFEYVYCNVCGKYIRLKSNGTLLLHKGINRANPAGWCSGTNTDNYMRFDNKRESETVATTNGQIEYHLKRIALLEEKAAKEEEAKGLFGIEEDNSDPWPDETVFFFKRNFGSDREYSYCALKAGQYWYVTGRKQEGYHVTFWDLIWKFLVPAWEETQNVYVAAEWTYVTEL